MPGEAYDLAMLCGVEYDECSDMWGETDRSMLGSDLTSDK